MFVSVHVQIWPMTDPCMDGAHVRIENSALSAHAAIMLESVVSNREVVTIPVRLASLVVLHTHLICLRPPSSCRE